MAEPAPSFDPYAILAALERERVAYVLIGAFARVLHGAEEVTDALDLVPGTRAENLQRLERALGALGANGAEGAPATITAEAPAGAPVHRLMSARGALSLVPTPTGTGGYEDLRRGASREPIGRGLRPAVASLGDLARMLAALGRETDEAHLGELRQLMELERSLGHGLER